MKPNRPTSVSVIAWFLIIAAVVQFMIVDHTRNSATGTPLLPGSTLPIPTQFLLVYGHFALCVVCGALLFNGFNWARFLFLLQGLAMQGLMLRSTSFGGLALADLIVFAVTLLVLFLPSANAWFRGDVYGMDLRGRYWQGH